MAASEHSEESSIVFYVGQHESKRSYHVTEEILRHAQDCNYDMLTMRITNDSYHARVLSQLSLHLSSLEDPSTLSSYSLPGQAHVAPAPILAALNPADTGLLPSEAISQLLLVTSPWIDLASPDPLIADISRQVLNQEMAYAAFCGGTNIIVQGPPSRYAKLSVNGLTRYARAIQEVLCLGPYLQMHIMLPMTGHPQTDTIEDIGSLVTFARDQFFEDFDYERDIKTDAFESWDSWNVIRTVCRYSSRLSIALTLPRQLPSISLQSRWFSEPLRILNIPGTSFLRDARGNHVLSQTHQQLVYRYMRLRPPPWILLSDVGPLPGMKLSDNLAATMNGFSSLDTSIMDPDSSMLAPSEPTPAEASRAPLTSHPTKAPEPHVNYFRHHLQRNQPLKPLIERFGAGYQDYLQNPLQPLTVNLESITYEVFEKDPIKYDWYERAIAAALTDWAARGKPTSGPAGRVVVAVLGAGRGPLVTRALQGSASSGIKIDLWAVEKNPNAFVQLQRHNLAKWDNRVNLVHSDMRSWGGPSYSTAASSSSSLLPTSPSAFNPVSQYDSRQCTTRIDILISELLGSLGDNELSPECLDGAQHLLARPHGISIPASYTAHLTPIAAPKLHPDVQVKIAGGDSGAAEVPYVVMLHAIDYLSTMGPNRTTEKSRAPMSAAQSGKETRVKLDPVPVVLKAWEFRHPLPNKVLERSSSNMHNARFQRLEFPCRHQGVCHGIGGYFEAVLYTPASSSVTAARAVEMNTGDETVEGQRKYREAEPEGGVEYSREAEGIGGSKIELSTNPLTMDMKSKDMISWFPIFFPLKAPMYIPANSLLCVSIWRQTDGRKVWYEWMVESFGMLQSGKRVRLGCSDLHSSIRSGCLM